MPTKTSNPLRVLILSTDALAAALIAAAAEVAGFEPVFASSGESPRDALLRLRPRVVLVDSDHDRACSEAFFGPALMAGARVAVFTSPRSRRALEPGAAAFGVLVFRLPADVAELGRLLEECAYSHET